MATPSTTDGEHRRRPGIVAQFTAGAGVAARRPLLALVPLVAGLLSVGRLERAARADVTFQLNFGFPAPVADLWTFLNAPSESGVSVFGYSGRALRTQPELLLVGLATAAVTLLFLGLLTAVYLGAVDDALAGRTSDHRANLRRHAPVTVAFAAIQFVGLLAFSVVGLVFVGPGRITDAGGLLFLLVFLVSIAGYYLLTPGVYAGVAAGLDPLPAFERGFDIALTPAYLVFALAHVFVVVAVSVPLSALAFSSGLPSLLLVAAVAAPIGLWLNAATMALVRSRLDGVATPGGGPDHEPAPVPAVRRLDDGDGR